jgi:hypothetical protein
MAKQIQEFSSKQRRYQTQGEVSLFHMVVKVYEKIY